MIKNRFLRAAWSGIKSGWNRLLIFLHIRKKPPVIVHNPVNMLPPADEIPIEQYIKEAELPIAEPVPQYIPQPRDLPDSKGAQKRRKKKHHKQEKLEKKKQVQHKDEPSVHQLKNPSKHSKKKTKTPRSDDSVLGWRYRWQQAPQPADDQETVAKKKRSRTKRVAHKVVKTFGLR